MDSAVFVQSPYFAMGYWLAYFALRDCCIEEEAEGKGGGGCGGVGALGCPAFVMVSSSKDCFLLSFVSVCICHRSATV